MAGSETYSIRIAEQTDADEIGHLLHEFNREFEEPTPGAAVLAERIRLLIEHGDTAVLLAGEEPDGVAVLRFRPAIWTKGLECYLAELYVVPGKRGQGIGRALMERAMTYARERGADTMDIGVDEPDAAARALYESLGFSHRSSGGHGALMFVYEREL